LFIVLRVYMCTVVISYTDTISNSIIIMTLSRTAFAVDNSSVSRLPLVKKRVATGWEF